MDNLNTKYLAESYPQVEPMEFYRELFPSGELEQRGKFITGKYNAIAIQVIDKTHSKRFTVCDDLEPLPELIQQENFLIISPVSYAGKRNKLNLARDLYAIAFDLDGLIVKDEKPSGLINLIHQITVAEFHPMPTYIVSSGNGVHLYYILERPLQLFQNVVKQVREYRKYFTSRLWNEYITTLSTNPQYESVTQGFRAVGSICKDGEQRAIAFRTGEKVSIEYLNKFVVDEQAKIKDFTYKSALTLADAKEKFPEWYEKRIELKQPKGTWTVKKDLYYWWIRQIESGATVGHRYYCIMCLAVYARKCGVSYEELEKDAFRLMPFLDKKSPADGSNKFDESDVMKALEAYSTDYITFPRDTISELTAIPIKANKRNYRKQEIHLERMRALLEVDYPNGKWINKSGAPKKKDLVINYYKQHPHENISQIATSIGCDRKTVRKWIKWFKENQPNEGE